jgi:hypothetical protein
MTDSNFIPIKRIVSRKIGDKRPFLIEFEGFPKTTDYRREPWSSLSPDLQKKFCKDGKVRKNKPKRKRKLHFPPVPHKPENHAVIPAKRPRGAVEYSLFENENGESILVMKTYQKDRVDYQHFHRISRSMSETNGVRGLEPTV